MSLSDNMVGALHAQVQQHGRHTHQPHSALPEGVVFLTDGHGLVLAQRDDVDLVAQQVGQQARRLGAADALPAGTGQEQYTAAQVTE